MDSNSITNDFSQRKVAIIAGISLLVMAILAGFGYGFVFNSLVVKGNAVETYNNIVAADTLFRFGIFSWLMILVLDVLVAWSLYIFFKKANQHISLLVAWFRLIYAAFFGVSLLNYIIVLLLISGVDYLKVFEINQLQALVLLFINAFQGIWSLSLIIFGLHLLFLAYLVLKTKEMPKIIGILLLIAAISYLIIHLSKLFFPQFQSAILSMEMILALPMAISELGLGLWLLFKGGKLA